MAGSFTLPTVLANLAAGNQALSLVDGDLNALANPLLALGTFGNYYVDSGGANAYVITVSSPQTVALVAGLPIQFKATNANTGASTVQINALAAKNILNPDGSALGAGQIPAGGIVSVQYDGTQFLLIGASPPATGTWVPVLTFATPGDLAVTYAVQVAKYAKQGNLVHSMFNIVTSAFSFTTASGALQVTGSPFASDSSSHQGALIWRGITKAGYTDVVCQLFNGSTMTFSASGSGQTNTGITAADTPTGGTVVLRGSIAYFV